MADLAKPWRTAPATREIRRAEMCALLFLYLKSNNICNQMTVWYAICYHRSMAAIPLPDTF